MSIRVQAAVWDHAPREVQGSLLLVLLVIADHASDDGANAWPSISRIADRCRLDRRTVQRHLRRLQDLNLIQCEHRAGNAPREDRRPNRYRVCMEQFRGAHGAAPVSPRDGDGAAPVSPRDGACSSERGGTSVANGAAPMPPEPSLNHPRTPPTRAREAEPREDQDVGVGGSDPQVRSVLTALAEQVGISPAGLARDRRVWELHRRVVELLARGWTRGELAESCTGPPDDLRYPAAWMLRRLAPLDDQRPPSAVWSERAAETTAALERRAAVEATTRPDDLDLPAFLQPAEEAPRGAND